MKRLLASLVICSLGWGAHPAQAADRLGELYSHAKDCYYGLKSSSAKRAVRGNWLECIGRFQAVYDLKPESPEAYTSLYTEARLYDRLYDTSRQREDQARALYLYNQVISEYEGGRLTDDALYHQGEILLAESRKQEALERFRRVADFYPDSDHMAKVEERLAELAAVRPAATVVLESIDYSMAADGSVQIVTRGTGPIEWTQNKLNRPSRVYFNFPNTRLGSAFTRDLEVKGGALTRIRASQFNENTSRLVLDLDPVDKLKVVTRRQGTKLVIALTDIELSPVKVVEQVPVPDEPAKPNVALAAPQAEPRAPPAREAGEAGEGALDSASVVALLDSILAEKPTAPAAAPEQAEMKPLAAVEKLEAAEMKPLPRSAEKPAVTEEKPVAAAKKPEAVEKPLAVAEKPAVAKEKPVTAARVERSASEEKPAEATEEARVPEVVKPVARKPLALLAESSRAQPPEVAKKISTIVLDPGHGGKDYGAKGHDGLYEKEVNLKVAKRLKKILEARYNYRVVLTRDDDTFIPLDKRGDVANKLGAELFVSIHANAAERRSAHGIETYYLGTGHSAQAQETAARENGDLVRSVKDDQVQQILASLISTTKINDSAMLAGHVQDELYTHIKKIQPKVRDLGVKEGPFYVLHDTNMPSILVEVGFVTHRREGRSLKRSKYLDQLATAIAKGIGDFLNDRGPTI